MALSSLELGQERAIKQVGGSGQLRQRLLDMGLTRGTNVRIIHAAPLGDPLIVGLRGYKLMLRKNEADCIQL